MAVVFCLFAAQSAIPSRNKECVPTLTMTQFSVWNKLSVPTLTMMQSSVASRNKYDPSPIVAYLP